MLDVKMTDQMTGLEIAGHEIAGQKSGKGLRLSRLSIDLAASL